MEFKDIIYEKKDGIAKITINRPEVYNAFRRETVQEMLQTLEDAGGDGSIGVVVITGAGDKAFCVGGDTGEKGDRRAGYAWEGERLHNKLYDIIRKIPQPVIAAVNGYAIGGGHVLHFNCDLTIASENAKFGQVGPRVGSAGAGFNSQYLTRIVGEKRAREIWYMCHQYTAQEAFAMGLVNKVVPQDKLEEEVDKWCQELLDKSPHALRLLKIAFNADSEYLTGYAQLGQLATWAYWHSEEAYEGRLAWLQKREPDFSRFRTGIPSTGGPARE